MTAFRNIVKISAPIDEKKLSKLKCSDAVAMTGTIYTIRDMSLKKLRTQKKAVLNFKNAAVYFCAPTDSKKPGIPIGAFGPTTTARMESGIPFLLGAGAKTIIGKGPISEGLKRLFSKNNCVYLLATGGCGAYYSKFAKSSKIILFPELGPEAVRVVEVKDFPLVVAVDLKGKNIFHASNN